MASVANRKKLVVESLGGLFYSFNITPFFHTSDLKRSTPNHGRSYATAFVWGLHKVQKSGTGQCKPDNVSSDCTNSVVWRKAWALLHKAPPRRHSLTH